MALGKVYFIGAGPGDPKLITIRGREALQSADLVVYAGSLVNPDILNHCRTGARIVDSSALPLAGIVDELLKASRAGEISARVHTGEPSLYGAIAEQIELLSKENIPVEIIPGVSSAFAAAASLGIEYTLPDVSQTLILTRAPGRTGVPAGEALSSLAAHRASMVIFLSIAVIDSVVEELISGGYPDTTPAAVVYRASWPDERTVAGTLATIAGRVKEAGISRQALILVGDAVGKKLRSPSKLYDEQFSHGYRAGEKKPAAIIAVTRSGGHTARRILRIVEGAELFLPLKMREKEAEFPAHYYDDLQQAIAQAFFRYTQLILVMAAGIAVRLIAPHLMSKWHDPGVVVIDDRGKNAISLLSGHWGGANELARKLAAGLGGNPVITTESDVDGYPAVDMLVKALTGGQTPAQPRKLKDIEACILNGDDVGFYPKTLRFFPGMTGHANIHFFDSVEELYLSGCAAGVIACGHAQHPVEVKEQFLLVTVRDVVVGMGCHRGTGADEIEAGIARVLSDCGLSEKSLSMVCSVDKKSCEPGIGDYCRRHGLKASWYTADEINDVKTPSAESPHSLKVLGVKGVAEPCAILGSRGGELLKHKTKLKNMTVAVARIPMRELLDQGT